MVVTDQRRFGVEPSMAISSHRWSNKEETIGLQAIGVESDTVYGAHGAFRSQMANAHGNVFVSGSRTPELILEGSRWKSGMKRMVKPLGISLPFTVLSKAYAVLSNVARLERADLDVMGQWSQSPGPGDLVRSQAAFPFRRPAAHTENLLQSLTNPSHNRRSVVVRHDLIVIDLVMSIPLWTLERIGRLGFDSGRARGLIHVKVTLVVQSSTYSVT